MRIEAKEMRRYAATDHLNRSAVRRRRWLLRLKELGAGGGLVPLLLVILIVYLLVGRGGL